MGDMFTRYTKWLRDTKDVSDCTIATKSFHLGKFERSVNKPMDKITEDDVCLYMSTLKKDGLKGSTRGSYLVSIGAFFTWALEFTENDKRVYPKITHNPTTKAKKEFTADKIEYKPVDTPKNIREKLLGVCELERDALIVELVTALGLRIGEASRAQYTDIQFRDIKGVSTPCLRVKGKGKQIRWLTVKPELMSMLLARQNGNPYLVRNLRKEGQGMCPPSIGRRIKFLIDKAELDITAHTLRAAVITQIAREIGPSQAQKVAGHNDISTTQRYIRLGLEDVQDALEVV